MRKLIFLTIISLISFTQMNAQSKTPTAEQKQTLNPMIDQGFTEWTRTWSYDKYVGRSAKITSLTVDDDYGDIIAYGEFTYRRLYQNFTITFTANIAVSNEGFRLVKLSYVDNNGQRDSKTF